MLALIYVFFSVLLVDDRVQLMEQADRLVIKKEYAKAIELYDKAIALDRDDPAAFVNRAICRNKMGRSKEALADCNEAIRLNPKVPFFYVTRAFFYVSQADLDRAFNDYTAALKIDPEYIEAYLERATLYAKRKDYQQALNDFQSATKANPKHPYGYNGQAWIYATCPNAKFRRGSEAVKLATKACELSDWKDPFCLDTLGTAYAEDGNFEQAIKYQKMALANEEFASDYVAKAKKRLSLYETKRPYRDE